MALPLIPAPARVTASAGSFELGSGLPVVVGSAELSATAQQFIDDVRVDTGVMLALAGTARTTPAITVSLAGDDLGAVAPAAGVRADGRSTTDGDERHGLSIAADGVRVWGPTVEGVHRGLTSLRQLIAAGAGDGLARLPAATILDGPRFAWRGLSLDVVRTFHGPATVRRVIDLCSLYKLNVLHLHLSDDQGWRIAVPSRPELTAIGAAGALGDRPGGFYSPAELAGLVEYAAARFVTLVPEIDLPGHTGAVFRAYPELAPTDPRAGDVSPGLAIGTLDPQRAATWAFVEDVLDAVIPQFPQSAYLHIGGDEAFGMADDAHAAFVERTIGLVRARARFVVGWQEIARAPIGPGEIVQHWIDLREAPDPATHDALAAVPAEIRSLIAETMAKAGHDVSRALDAGARLLLSPTSRLYFDQPHAEASADPVQVELRARVGLPVYPAMPLRQGVEWDPADTPGVTSDDQLAGVEAAIWCETIATRDELEFLLLPRLPGAAEKAWARPGITDWSTYAPRLAAQAELWNARGWNWFAADSVAWAPETLGAR